MDLLTRFLPNAIFDCRNVTLSPVPDELAAADDVRRFFAGKL